MDFLGVNTAWIILPVTAEATELRL